MEMDRDSFAEQVMSRVGNMLGGGHDIRIHRASKRRLVRFKKKEYPVFPKPWRILIRVVFR